MRMRIQSPFISLPVLFPFFAVCFADNPIIQTNYTADPAPMVYNGCVYLFTSHDDDVIEGDFYTMRNYCCYSSKDIVNWTDHGIVASLKEFKWITVNNGAWAPQCVEREGKFYLYIPIQGKGIGVQVSESPIGPFKDAIGKALINKNGYSDIDPTVFIDSDGQAYLYWGNGTLWYVKLNKDMISYTGNIVTVSPKPTGFVEGPWFYKRNDLYYLVYASMGSGAENIQYATSTAPTGPWTSKGILMPTQGGCYTNHPGVFDFKDHSYLFYHNQALQGGGSYHRSVCLEQFAYTSDGSFPSLNMSKNGPEQVGSLNPYDTVQAETICWASGVRTQVCGEGGINVDSIHNGDYIKVKGVDFGPGAKSFEARVASGGSGGSIELRLDASTGTLAGTCSVAGTGGWQTWTTKSCDITGTAGVHDLYIKFTGGSGLLFNFNWWRFMPAVKTIPSRAAMGEVKQPITVTTGAGFIKLDFSRPVSRGKVNVSLFDLNGRRGPTLFNGNVTSSRLILPIRTAGIRTEAYLINVSLNDKEVLINTIKFLQTP
jgi:arabinoxylan arabinofuranohydrolase